MKATLGTIVLSFLLAVSLFAVQNEPQPQAQTSPQPQSGQTTPAAAPSQQPLVSIQPQSTPATQPTPSLKGFGLEDGTPVKLPVGRNLPSGTDKKGSWSDLNALRAGQGIEVIESSMKRHRGEFVTVTDELLTLKERGSDVSIKRENVARVSTSSGPKRGAHAVIGLVAGAAIGAGIGAASGSNHGFLGGSSRGITALVGLAIGGVSGAAVGALVPAHTTVYRVPAAVPK